ncbi:hypothetical protein SDC9_117407 [bioreactor metagenome]|uniref:Uncharacterized protein n=1 Tax=bioreactor metagenome TaxID=1076179 RepID=A0A645BYN6_9ZZZZ
MPPDGFALPQRLRTQGPGHRQAVDRADQIVRDRHRYLVGHQYAQHLNRESVSLQLQRLGQIGHADAAGPRTCGQRGHEFRAYAVSVGFQYRKDQTVADPFPDCGEIMLQTRRIHLEANPA